MRAVAYALEIIPRTLITNCGADVVRSITDLRSKHANEDGLYYGIDGIKGIHLNSSGRQDSGYERY